MSFTQTLFLLIAGHAVADYPLQGEFLAMGKSRAKPSPFIPWYQALGAHALIHGGMVALITGIWWLGLMEAVCQAVFHLKKQTLERDPTKILFCSEACAKIRTSSDFVSCRDKYSANLAYGLRTNSKLYSGSRRKFRKVKVAWPFAVLTRSPSRFSLSLDFTAVIPNEIAGTRMGVQSTRGRHILNPVFE